MSEHSPFPLHLEPVQHFAAVREYLEQSGYTEQSLLDHFQVPSLHSLLYAYGIQGDHVRSRYLQPGRLPFLARLFFGGYAATPDELAEHLTSEVEAALRALNLLTPENRCPVLLYPALGLYVASDRGFTPEDDAYRAPDYVMSGAEYVCRLFLSAIPSSPCRRFLDMGAGSGLAALSAARSAGQVWGVDITSRAVSFATFNAKLNGLDNTTFLQGDLFAPVKHLTFDRIACNPPFEPPLKSDLIFSVGGDDGEAIMARLFAEGPAYLEPGGRLYCMVSGTDREGDPFEQRIQRWLGSWATECDLALFVRQSMKPTDYAISQILGENQDAWKLEDWNSFYSRLKARAVVIGHAVLQRRAAKRPVFLRRLSFGPHTGLPEIEAFLDRQTALSTLPQQALLGSAPRSQPGWQLHVRHRPANNGLQPQSYTFVTEYPFAAHLAVPAWAALFAARCDGSSTAAAHLAFLRSKAEVSEEEFCRVLSLLVSTGVLSTEAA